MTIEQMVNQYFPVVVVIAIIAGWWITKKFMEMIEHGENRKES